MLGQEEEDQIRSASPTWSWDQAGPQVRVTDRQNKEKEEQVQLASSTWSRGQAGLQVGVINGEPLPGFQEGVVVQPRGLLRVNMLTQLPQLVICEVGLQDSPPCV